MIILIVAHVFVMSVHNYKPCHPLLEYKHLVKKNDLPKACIPYLIW